jgi:hypothetical protein
MDCFASLAMTVAGRYAEIAVAESTWSGNGDFWIFPVDVFGMTPNSTAFGALKSGI